jgi:hypothetical protein
MRVQPSGLPYARLRFKLLPSGKSSFESGTNEDDKARWVCFLLRGCAFSKEVLYPDCGKASS